MESQLVICRGMVAVNWCHGCVFVCYAIWYPYYQQWIDRKASIHSNWSGRCALNTRVSEWNLLGSLNYLDNDLSYTCIHGDCFGKWSMRLVEWTVFSAIVRSVLMMECTRSVGKYWVSHSSEEEREEEEKWWVWIPQFYFGKVRVVGCSDGFHLLSVLRVPLFVFVCVQLVRVSVDCIHSTWDTVTEWIRVHE